MSEASLSVSADSRPRQNWILGPWRDAVLIIAAPVLALAWTAGLYLSLGKETVIFVFGILNVAHHYPTFLRIYGDRALLKRFRWNLILGPLIPMTLFIGIAAWLISNGYGVESLFFLFIILTLWDPWHFLMQHYGFMRIYDRHNHAPRKLSSRMDLTLCWSWFLYIMLATVDWLPDLLYLFYTKHGVNLLVLFDSGVLPFLVSFTLGAAVVATLVYAGYLVWCFRRGYYVSRVKLLLAAITFGLMYLTYVPNGIMRSAIPTWSFSLGFITLGFVHIAQYLAIVWKYNRSLASRPDASRRGFFTSSFARGGLLIGLLYFLACSIWGFFLSEEGLLVTVDAVRQFFTGDVVKWLAVVGMAAGFTSTLLHYYYDGFIWKVRHNENRRNLAPESDEPKADTSAETDAERPHTSWWHQAYRSPPGRTLLRQSLYFGVPMLVITFTYHAAPDLAADDPDARYQSAIHFAQNGIPARSRSEAALALQAVDQRVAVEEQMLEIRDRPWHWVQLANLFRLRSQIHPIVAPGDIEASRSDLQRAIDALEKAINANEFIASQKNPEQVRADFAAKIKEWRNELTGTETDADENANETSGTAEAAAGSNDVESRRKLVGVWTQNKFGNRTLTIAGDGTGLMTMEPEAIYAVLYGSKLTFKMYWSVKDGFINYGYRSGTPTDKVRMAAETIGDHWIEKIIELTDNRLVLLEADGTTKSIWDRKPSRGGPPGANQAQRPGR